MNEIVDAFHKLYYDNADRTWNSKSQTKWLGVPVWKCPLDLWIIQEIVFETRPDLVIEAGTAYGGSALFYASLFDLIGNGEVITIDSNEPHYGITADVVANRPRHSRITYLTGSSISQDIIDQVSDKVESEKLSVMVDLDACHNHGHVLLELRSWSRLVTVNNYLIVEDSNVNGHPVAPDHGPGPWEAIEDFLQENKDFQIDEVREKFYLTFNPRGYLKRIR